MSDQPYQSPPEFDLYHACIAAGVEIDNGLISLLETGVTFKDPSIKEIVLESLRDISDQITEATDRFEASVGKAKIAKEMSKRVADSMAREPEAWLGVAPEAGEEGGQ